MPVPEKLRRARKRDKGRRTQEERTAATRAALLDATIECLVELGYEGTTTSRVAERAGVSRGAHLHHFQTRAELVATALERLAQRRVAELRAEAERMSGGRDRARRGLDLLWRQFSGPLFLAAIELAVAARTDGELSTRLEPVERLADRETLSLCRGLFAGDPQSREHDRWIHLALSTIRGQALLRILNPSRSPEGGWRASRDYLLELYPGA
jgi:AcrR family transcriptional regulator